MSTLSLIAASVSILALAVVTSGILVLSIKDLMHAFADRLALRLADECKANDGRRQVMRCIA